MSRKVKLTAQKFLRCFCFWIIEDRNVNKKFFHLNNSRLKVYKVLFLPSQNVIFYVNTEVNVKQHDYACDSMELVPFPMNFNRLQGEINHHIWDQASSKSKHDGANESHMPEVVSDNLTSNIISRNTQRRQNKKEILRCRRNITKFPVTT